MPRELPAARTLMLQMKNIDEFVSGPRLPMERQPGPVCWRTRTQEAGSKPRSRSQHATGIAHTRRMKFSSLKSSPHTLSPPVPSPRWRKHMHGHASRLGPDNAIDTTTHRNIPTLQHEVRDHTV